MYPPAEIELELIKLASDTGAKLEFRRLYRGYADYAVITRPASSEHSECRGRDSERWSHIQRPH